MGSVLRGRDLMLGVERTVVFEREKSKSQAT